MKNIISLFAILSLSVLLSSCDKEDSLPPDSTRMKEIAANRVRIGTNQKILFSCPVYLAPEATDVSILWTTSDDKIAGQESYETGISYQTFSWTNPGEYNVTCRVNYSYGDNGLRSVEKSCRVMIRKCHFLNSFIYDDMATVMSDNPDISQSEDGGYIYKESDKITHVLYFENNQLWDFSGRQ